MFFVLVRECLCVSTNFFFMSVSMNVCVCVCVCLCVCLSVGCVLFVGEGVFCVLVRVLFFCKSVLGVG